MRIAALQFTPRLGKVDANIRRADEVLAKAMKRFDAKKPLDLLVLPEMAFSGYNFSSLSTIRPYLEPTGAGPTADWVRATAQRLNCVVCAGYPEIKRTQPVSKLAASIPLMGDGDGDGDEQEARFNSLLIADSRGKTLMNYQKRFLYYTDDTWAAEGENGKGFFQCPISKPDGGASNSAKGENDTSVQGENIPTAVGICMDINPYKFISPYTAYEFATDVLDSGAKLVILSTAWLTLLGPEELSTQAKKPDMDTFQYWVKRFWPFVSGDKWDGGEIVIVIANRTGEDEGMEGKETARFAGTSCVMAIRRPKKEIAAAGDGESSGPVDLSDAEIVVWDMLGRAEEAVCFADTDLEPKMVFRIKNAAESD